MKPRPEWLARIESNWKSRNVIWLYGVRRSGKTTLCRSISGIVYLDCELPSVRRRLADPEAFLEDHADQRVALDEIHRLDSPSEFLKVAADHYPSVRIIATGSSSLGALRQFRDTLAGRKSEIWLTPMTHRDLAAFGSRALRERLQRGGLPQFFLTENPTEADYQEWVDAYWSRDIAELFRVERRGSFLRFTEMLLAASGGIFEASRYAAACEVSRQTITNYLTILSDTRVAHVIRPFTTRKPTEIVSAPKVYGFDTGFVARWKGWDSLRPEDLGQLWEQYILNELQADPTPRTIGYWRDKQGHEVDFVLATPRSAPTAIECKWRAAEFDPGNLAIFRKKYPEGASLVVAQDVDQPYRRRMAGIMVEFIGIGDLPGRLQASSG